MFFCGYVLFLIRVADLFEICNLPCWTLPSGMVNGVFSRQEDLGDGHKGVAVLKELFQNSGESFRGVFGSVVEQDDGAGLDLGGHPPGDLRGGEVFPVQTIHVPYRFKKFGIHTKEETETKVS